MVGRQDIHTARAAPRNMIFARRLLLCCRPPSIFSPERQRMVKFAVSVERYLMLVLQPLPDVLRPDHPGWHNSRKPHQIEHSHH